MTEKIQVYLEVLERERAIKILLACETGSRAWGFPSPDSDFDIRIIYVHNVDWYLTVNERKDFIEMMLENNDLDITGWELKKALQLLKKSNASLLERIQSPIIYKADEAFIADIFEVANACYSKIATMHHYLSMAKKMVEEIESKETFKLKKFFYALRTATLCKWILDKNSIPPIDFKAAYQNLNLAQEIVDRIDELIVLKSSADEAYLHTQEPHLMAFINDCIRQAEMQRHTLPGGNCQSEAVNQLFKKYVHKYDN